MFNLTQIFLRRAYHRQKHVLVISVVPSDREGLQADEAIGVLRQHHRVPVQPHLVHVGSDVITGVPSAERLICYC